MNTLALFLIAFGLMIIVSRAPLIVAPGATRSAYLAFISTDRRMRLFGLFAASLGGLVFWIGLTNSGVAAEILNWLGVAIVALSLGGMIPFPGPARKLAETIWTAISPPALRLVGLLSSVAGAALIYYGLTL